MKNIIRTFVIKVFLL